MNCVGETTPDPKQTWFDETETHGTGNALTPKSMAAFTSKQYIVTLQPNIESINENLGLQHFGLQAKALNKCFHISKMEEDGDVIPRSARSDFNLRVSAKTEKTQELISLEADTAVFIEQVRKTFKDMVIKATKIEYQFLKIQIATDLVSSFRLATKAFLITDGIFQPSTLTLLSIQFLVLAHIKIVPTLVVYLKC
jgi:hypothetical protein